MAPTEDEKAKKWKITREKILLNAGLIMMGSQIAIEILQPENFRFEFLIAGGALCGISIAQWGDRRF